MLVTASVAGGCADEGPPHLPGLVEPCGGDLDTYLIDAILFGTDGDEVAEFAFDMDGDGSLDNQLGNLHTALQPLPAQETINAAIAADTIVLALSVEVCGTEMDYPREARVELHAGAFVERDGAAPRVHLHGFNGVPAVEDVGGLFGNVFSSRGTGWLPLSAFIDVPGSPPSWVLGHQFMVELDSRSPAEIDGRMAIGPHEADVRRTISPAVARHAAVLLDGEPGCPLACEDEALARMVDLLDENGDGTIQELEFRTNPVVITFMRPDLDLLADWNGMSTWWPGHDGEPESLSLGFGFHAVRAELVTD